MARAPASQPTTGRFCRRHDHGGSADAPHHELCDTFHLPLVNFVDEPGFMIGPEAEANGTIRYGMAAVAAASQAATPWASVQIHKNFGVASAAHYGPDTYVLNWPSAIRAATH